MEQMNENTWTRKCPVCNEHTEHKNRAKCQGAERLKVPCKKCSAKEKALRRATKDTCPLCHEIFNVKYVDDHAKLHNISSEQLWLIKHDTQPRTCRCGCGEITTWVVWNDVGYNEFVNRHSSNIYSAFSPEKAKDISDRRRAKLIGTISWAKGLTKETDERVKIRAENSAIGIRKSFDEGREAWSKGLTKETDVRLATFSKLLSDGYASGKYIPWAKGKTKETDPAIAAMAANVSITHKRKEIRERLDALKRLTKDQIYERIRSHNRLELISDLNDYKSKNTNNVEVCCKSCNGVFITSIDRLIMGRCELCAPNLSVAHGEIVDFIRNLGFQPQINNRSIIPPFELDIFVPEKNLAIEYNGLYWHSEINKSSIYHENKTNLCRAKDIKLFHVFQDEWTNQSEIVKSMIKHRLGSFDQSIGARKCQIVSLDNRQRIDFFERNHVDDDTSAGYTLGLIYNDDIVAALSLRKPFHKKYDVHLEIGRFCTKINTNVPGALGRLSKASRNYAGSLGYENLITYVDTRLGNGSAYEQAGFVCIGHTKPRFWWTDMKYRFNRFKFRAELGKSEAQVAAENGVVKIWGCKNILYEMKI